MTLLHPTGLLPCVCEALRAVTLVPLGAWIHSARGVRGPDPPLPPGMLCEQRAVLASPGGQPHWASSPWCPRLGRMVCLTWEVQWAGCISHFSPLLLVMVMFLTLLGTQVGKREAVCWAPLEIPTKTSTLLSQKGWREGSQIKVPQRKWSWECWQAPENSWVPPCLLAGTVLEEVL